MLRINRQIQNQQQQYPKHLENLQAFYIRFEARQVIPSRGVVERPRGVPRRRRKDSTPGGDAPNNQTQQERSSRKRNINRGLRHILAIARRNQARIQKTKVARTQHRRNGAPPRRPWLRSQRPPPPPSHFEKNSKSLLSTFEASREQEKDKKLKTL